MNVLKALLVLRFNHAQEVLNGLHEIILCYFTLLAMIFKYFSKATLQTLQGPTW